MTSYEVIKMANPNRNCHGPGGGELKEIAKSISTRSTASYRAKEK